jgi:hypothetical protein
VAAEFTGGLPEIAADPATMGLISGRTWERHGRLFWDWTECGVAWLLTGTYICFD